MKSKKHYLISFSILMIVSVFLVKIIKPDIFQTTSEEMIYLRSVEDALRLPSTYVSRKETDEGKSVDFKGAPHYVRNIWVHYKDFSKIEQIQDNLQNDGWSIVDSEEFSEYNFTRGKIYTKAGVRACVRTNIYDQNIYKNQYDHFVAIMAPQELGCEIQLFGTPKT